VVHGQRAKDWRNRSRLVMPGIVTRRGAYPSTPERFNCPHAANTSRPRGFRTKHGIDAATIRWKARTRSSAGAANSTPGPAFHANRFSYSPGESRNRATAR
jgi:hypothetical protein